MDLLGNYDSGDEETDDKKVVQPSFQKAEIENGIA